MGYAIIKDLAGNKNYALNRQIQNLIPKDSNMRVYIEDAEGTKSFSYGEGANGIYKLASVNLGNATQPYEYVLDQSKTGVSVDPISGVITVTSDLANETNVTVNLIPVFDNTYYPITGHTASYKLQKTVQVTPPEQDSPEVHTDTYAISISSFTYNAAPATGGSSTPTVNYVIYKNGDPLENVAAQLRYTTTSESTGPVTARTDDSFATNGTIIFGANSANSKQYFTHIQVTATYLDVSDTAEASAQQSAATTPSEDVYSELNYTKDFVVPNYSTTDGWSGTISLPENLSQTVNDDPVTNIGDASYTYSINGGVYQSLDTSQTPIKVYIGENNTNLPISYTLTVKVSLNDKDHSASETLVVYPAETVEAYRQGYTVLNLPTENNDNYRGSISAQIEGQLSTGGWHTIAIEAPSNTSTLKTIVYHPNGYSTHVGLMTTTVNEGSTAQITGVKQNDPSTDTNGKYTFKDVKSNNTCSGQIITFNNITPGTKYSICVKTQNPGYNIYYKFE